VRDARPIEVEFGRAREAELIFCDYTISLYDFRYFTELDEDHEGCLLLIISKEVDSILIEILPLMIIPHDGLRVFMVTHHLHLPIALPHL
jgi:hypothetical protein